jgi:hypothetical protein
MEALPSEKDSSELLRSKMGDISLLDNIGNVPLPGSADKVQRKFRDTTPRTAAAAGLQTPSSTTSSSSGRVGSIGSGGRGSTSSNPWGLDEDDGARWFLCDLAPSYRQAFEAASEGGLCGPDAAKRIMTQSGLPREYLRSIWNLSDIDCDGFLGEFLLASFPSLLFLFLLSTAFSLSL